MLGAQKAGTTTLHAALRRAKGVSDGGLKEWHVLDRWLRPAETEDVGRIMAQAARAAKRPAVREAHAARAEALRRPEAMLEHFARVAPEARVFLDVSPDYALLRGEDWLVAREFYDAAGLRVRPVFLMRDPAQRLFSYARALAEAHGLQPGAALRAALEDEGAMLRSRYETTLAALWSVFPREEVTVAFHETLWTRPKALRRLAARLGVRLRAQEVRPRNVTRGAPAAEPRLAEAEARLAPTYEFARRWFGRKVPASWADPAPTEPAGRS